MSHLAQAGCQLQGQCAGKRQKLATIAHVFGQPGCGEFAATSKDRGNGMNSIWRMVSVGVLTLLLMIPLAMVDDLVNERQGSMLRAQDTISARWSPAQKIGGPVLMVPLSVEERSDVGLRRVERKAYALPITLDVDVSLEVEVRYYGIYEQPVYTARIDMSGSFDPERMVSTVQGKLDWSKAQVQLPLSDVRGVRRVARFQWSEVDLEVNSATFAGGAFSALVADLDSEIADKPANFSISLTLAGSRALQFLPLAREAEVNATAPWGDPGFIGAYLPDQRTIEDNEFQARWQVLALNRQFGQVLTDSTGWADQLQAAAFGFELVLPADTYQRSERSTKYGILFIAATFLGFFVFETVAGLRLHPIQYLFVGLGLCSFYLVLLALSEHIGFGLAYLLAAAALVAILGGYSSAILGRRSHGLAAGGLMAFIYLLLYWLVISESYSLLVGSIFLLVLLTLAMYLTRNIDWYSVNGTKLQRGETGTNSGIDR
jgi:inner membrane protein